MTMDGLVSDDMFNLPVVLPSSTLNQPISLINCGGWQLEVSKEQTVPFMILENGELSLRNVSDFPFLYENNLSGEGVMLQENGEISEQLSEKPQSEDVNKTDTQESKVENSLVKGSSTEIDNVEEVHINEDVEISESCLMENLVETVIMYKCKLCSFKSAVKESLSPHIKGLHLKNLKKEISMEFSGENGDVTLNGTGSNDKLVYMCGSCNEYFVGLVDCKIHMAQHLKGLMSSKTGKNQESGQDFVEALKKEKVKNLQDQPAAEDISKSEKSLESLSERSIKCTFAGCLAGFSTRLAHSRHEACHCKTSPKEFVCNYCSTIFTKWSMCANHLWRIHNIDVELFSCLKCKYKTATKVKMKNHLKIHGINKEFMCNECGKMFSQQPQLRNHEVTHMKDRPEEERPKWYTQKECDQCQKMFANSKSLKKHIQAVHSKLKPYVCQVCGHSSATKNMLQMHLRQHTGEKPFSCPSCPFTTGDHNSLRRHRMRHSGVRPYRCPHCPYSAIQNSSLKHHLVTWHLTDKNVKNGQSESPQTNGTAYDSVNGNNKKDKEISLHSNVLSAADTTFSIADFEFQPGQVSVTVSEETFKKNSLGGEMMLPSNQQGSKEMIIQIPMSPLGMSYLENHSLDSGGITLPADVTFE